jgi:hypothetical protein
MGVGVENLMAMLAQQGAAADVSSMNSLVSMLAAGMTAAAEAAGDGVAAAAAAATPAGPLANVATTTAQVSFVGVNVTQQSGVLPATTLAQAALHVVQASRVEEGGEGMGEGVADDLLPPPSPGDWEDI